MKIQLVETDGHKGTCLYWKQKRLCFDPYKYGIYGPDYELTESTFLTKDELEKYIHFMEQALTLEEQKAVPLSLSENPSDLSVQSRLYYKKNILTVDLFFHYINVFHPDFWQKWKHRKYDPHRDPRYDPGHRIGTNLYAYPESLQKYIVQLKQLHETMQE